MDSTESETGRVVVYSGFNYDPDVFDQMACEPTFHILSEDMSNALLANDVVSSLNNQLAEMASSLHNTFVEPRQIGQPFGVYDDKDIPSWVPVADNIPQPIQGSMMLSNISTMTTVPCTQHQYVKSEDWEKARPLITELYKEGSLKDVMREMRKRSFIARYVPPVLCSLALFLISSCSQKMYKNRIKKWGIEKKLKASEVVEIVRLHNERTFDQPTEFVVGGRVVSWFDVQRYLRRSQKSIAQLQAEVLRRRDSIPVIECRTRSSRVLASRAPATITMLELPDEMKAYETLSKLYITHINGATEKGTWTIDVEELDLTSQFGNKGFNRLFMWSDAIAQAERNIDITKTEKLHLVFAVINKCLDKTKQLIQEEEPSLLSEMIYTVMNFNESHPHISKEIASFFKQMTFDLLPQVHPLRLFWHHWDSYRELNLFKVIGQVYRPYIDFLIETLDIPSIRLHSAILSCTEAWLCLPNPPLEEVVQELKSILARFPKSSQKDCHTAKRIELLLANILVRQHADSHEATEILLAVEKWLPGPDNLDINIENVRWGWIWIKGLIHDGRHEWQNGYDLFHTWAPHFVRILGPTDVITMHCYEEMINYGEKLRIAQLEQHEADFEELWKDFSSCLWLEDDTDHK